MKYILFIITLLFTFSCTNEKSEYKEVKVIRNYERFTMEKVHKSYYSSGHDLYLLIDKKTGREYIGTLSGSFTVLEKQ